MTPWLITFASLWVLASAAVAMLPMRRQYLPGIALLLTAPVLLAALVSGLGWVAGLAFGFAVASMYRNPIRYFWRRARGRPVSLPPELAARTVPAGGHPTSPAPGRTKMRKDPS
ncbi:hypothetical protein BV394_13245 [Brevirhabdus pacifica]|uniref:Uncharacterized protein n=1 Tax=Brevirhabdus pacifica TaxID=1267768 RepID=A0A1U7DKZ8_9RHOB|nr:hypothetical protein BV394_13245 [Brevirhabdus pacifica]PJJ85307.1 uncharacterized protein DUF2484 [Brevirhabdus pacifica]